MEAIVEEIRQTLQNNIDEKTRTNSHRFFKEEVKIYGVNTALVGKIGNQYWKQITHLGKNKIFALCEELLSTGYCEDAFIVSGWLPNLSNEFQASDIYIFKNWIEKYIDNWAKCDGFCNHTVGDLIMKYPQNIEELKVWARTDQRWLKRAAAVTLILPARKGMYLQDIFEIANILLTDPDDMVQKGYGWMLKEASRLHQDEVFQFVMKNKRKMPRTALRYAIELMPDDLRKSAMLKDW
jgi:3-methyladenine DNA glycosylase AlkD